MDLDVPDPGSAELGDLPGGTSIVQRLVHTDRGSQQITEADVTQQLVWRQRLLDVEQVVIIELAKVGLMLRPFVGPVRVNRERQAGTFQHRLYCPDRLRVPAR